MRYCVSLQLYALLLLLSNDLLVQYAADAGHSDKTPVTLMRCDM